jgi:hypothetical protein
MLELITEAGETAKKKVKKSRKKAEAAPAKAENPSS